MRFSAEIAIADKMVSDTAPVFVIAEAGVNHNGNLDMAFKLIDVAAEAGADAVKFQAFKAEELILQNVAKAEYQTKTTAATENQYDMLKKLEITQEQNLQLRRYCTEKKIIFLTTPFDEKSLDELDALDLPAYKVASTDLTNLLFLKKIAQKKKPIFLSTGMSYLEEVNAALREIYAYNREVILLQCTANYPIEDNEANLNVLDTFKSQFDILLGYSDHTVGVGAAPYAIAKGARVVEKHFTIDRDLSGPDHKASLSPSQLKDFVIEIRRAERYMGGYDKLPTISESGNRLALQKCIVAKRLIKKGEILSAEDIGAKRTGGVGISPIYYRKVLGCVVNRDINKDEVITLQLLY